MRQPRRSFVSLVVAVAGLYPSLAGACRCREPSTAAAYSRAALVVIAEALEVRPRPEIHGDQLRLRVLEAWKSESPEILDVVTGTDCAYAVHAGEKHLLFLVRAEDGFTTGRCMGDVPISRSNGPLSWLRRHGKPALTVPSPH
jgi:hypothetical protein